MDISDRAIDRNFGHVYFRCVLPVDVNLDGRIDLVGPYTDKKSGEFGTLLMINYGTGRFATIGFWFYQGLGGICPDPEQPGFRRFIIRPRVDPALTWIEAE